MTFVEFYQSVIMGLVEAATEFLPVSSTGHLILADALLKFQGPPGHVFEVAIQLGAVLSVCVLYFTRLTKVVIDLPRDAGARHFAIASIVACVPAALAGALFHDTIKTVLFSPVVVCVALVIGGIAILLIEKWRPAPRVTSIEGMPYRTALAIGLAQCLALIPGVSRSGATIMGALAAGVDRRTAAEFSFFQAIPLIAGATVFDLWKARDALDVSGMGMIAVGFVTSFVGALAVIRWMLGYVTRHGFGVFAWYRIAAGCAGLAILLLSR
ncbi:MAG: undecaprenyl-diphosphate phosphatase [Rhodospirillales bacterium]|nr:undecaprenyl-diphosphate phosphatase [Alphaproteobacteria bacterium]MCB9986847.1 undecaprenyl-diphosphate phosphatase [Rhodospirillales bacterium]USO08391.1 MAG: undecaprenyl-diphosphate phosphatase [Rhodospirillales bacterium]